MLFAGQSPCLFSGRHMEVDANPISADHAMCSFFANGVDGRRLPRGTAVVPKGRRSTGPTSGEIVPQFRYCRVQAFRAR